MDFMGELNDSQRINDPVKKWANELNFFKGRSRYGQKNT
jgi:hypothetical protein